MGRIVNPVGLWSNIVPSNVKRMIYLHIDSRECKRVYRVTRLYIECISRESVYRVDDRIESVYRVRTLKSVYESVYSFMSYIECNECRECIDRSPLLRSDRWRPRITTRVYHSRYLSLIHRDHHSRCSLDLTWLVQRPGLERTIRLVLKLRPLPIQWGVVDVNQCYSLWPHLWLMATSDT